MPEINIQIITESKFTHGVMGIKKGVRIKIQPRFKIQYPMKNRGKDIR